MSVTKREMERSQLMLFELSTLAAWTFSVVASFGCMLFGGLVFVLRRAELVVRSVNGPLVGIVDGCIYGYAHVVRNCLAMPPIHAAQDKRAEAGQFLPAHSQFAVLVPSGLHAQASRFKSPGRRKVRPALECY